MAKKSAAPATTSDSTSSESSSESSPASSATQSETGTGSNPAAGPKLSKSDMVKEAIAAGHVKPAPGVAYIKATHGVDIDPQYFSAVKSRLADGGKNEFAAKGAGPKKANRASKGESTGRSTVSSAPASQPAGSFPGSMAAGNIADSNAPTTSPASSSPDQRDEAITAMEQIKSLVEALGADRVMRIAKMLE